MEIVDTHRPRFGRIRWAFIRGLLRSLNLVEGRFNRLREWALQEAVDSSPDFETFQTWVVTHYAQRGMRATVRLDEAVTPELPTPTHIANSTYLQ